MISKVIYLTGPKSLTFEEESLGLPEENCSSFGLSREREGCYF